MAIMTREEFERKFEEARVRVTDMDKADGYAERSLPVILAALQAGLRNPESGAAFDAYVMLASM